MHFIILHILYLFIHLNYLIASKVSFLVRSMALNFTIYILYIYNIYIIYIPYMTEYTPGPVFPLASYLARRQYEPGVYMSPGVY